MTPKVGADMIMLTGEHYARRDLTGLRDTLERALTGFAPNADTLALRDYHAENLIWREAHKATDRVGLLDFQDAFVAPAGYDLASLLRDARRDVPDDIADEMINHFTQKTGADATFRTQVACLGVQRNLRILGVFARLSKEMGKTRYLQFIPRVWGNIIADLNDPALAELRQAVLDHIPAPTPAYCEGLMP
jgi:aminoglycoside/choline kinase family phosphotransferase